LLHLKVEDALILTVLRVIKWGLNGCDSLKSIFITWAEILNFGVSNESFLRLLALFIKDTEVVPNLWLECVK
jgi:hypothetical protein